MEKQGKCRLVYNINKIPSGAIVLNPYAEKAVSYEDYRYVQRRGIVGLDCSWNEVSSSKKFFSLSKYHRSLPFLITFRFHSLYQIVGEKCGQRTVQWFRIEPSYLHRYFHLPLASFTSLKNMQGFIFSSMIVLLLLFLFDQHISVASYKISEN